MAPGTRRCRKPASQTMAAKLLILPYPRPLLAKSRAQRSTSRTSGKAPNWTGPAVLVRIHCLPNQVRNRRQAYSSIEERGNRHLVGGVEHDRQRRRRRQARETRGPGRETSLVSGAAKSSRPARARSSGGRGAVQRAGYENAYWIGSRMSVTPSCAMIEPSTSSTIECTIDCGCTRTSIRSGETSNSQRASITSSPLFINVAESIVIFGPIVHVGCRSASSGVTVRDVGEPACRGRVRPEAVRINRRTSAGDRPCRHW